MSSFLATLNTFPEFTSVSGRSSGVAGRILTELSRSGDLGKYIDKAFRRQIGLEEVDTTNQMVTRVFEKAGRYSALFGLSSPISGITKFSGSDGDKNSLPLSDKSIILLFSSIEKYSSSSNSCNFFSLI